MNRTFVITEPNDPIMKATKIILNAFGYPEWGSEEKMDKVANNDEVKHVVIADR